MSDLRWYSELPAGWERAKVLGHSELLNGYPFSSDFFDLNEGLPLIRIRDLGSQDTEVRFRGPVVEEALVHPGDILIGMDGDFNVARWEGKTALLNQRLCCLRPLLTLEPRFLHYLLPFPLKLINDLKHSTTVKHLSSGEVRSIEFGLPPLPEQGSIADFLDRETTKIDALVAQKQRLIELLQEKRTALLNRSVIDSSRSDTPRVRTENHQFPALPAHWSMIKLRRLLSRTIRAVKVVPEATYREIGIRSWGKGIFHKEAVRGELLGDKKVFRLRPGDFTLNIVFAWEGAVAVVSEQEEGMIASHRFPTFRHDPAAVDLDYLLMFFQSAHGRGLLDLNSPGAAGRNRTLRIGSLMNEEIPLPPLEEQQEIVHRFRQEEQEFEELNGRLSHAITLLTEYRTALISAAVTGKIDVRTTEASP